MIIYFLNMQGPNRFHTFLKGVQKPTMCVSKVMIQLLKQVILQHFIIGWTISQCLLMIDYKHVGPNDFDLNS